MSTSRPKYAKQPLWGNDASAAQRALAIRIHHQVRTIPAHSKVATVHDYNIGLRKTSNQVYDFLVA